MRKNWVLLAVAAGTEKGVEPVQLQKSLFLLGEHFRKKLGSGYSRFEPYDYGPFCKEVYEDAEDLQLEGLLTTNKATGGRWRVYRVTDKGAEASECIRETVNENAVEYIESIVKWTQSLTFSELVSAIYIEFPKYKSRSVFQG